MNNIFDTGFCFWYHPFYRNANSEICSYIKSQQSYPVEDNDFGGYTVSDLYVSPHFSSLKEEILNIVDIEQYNKEIAEKAMKHIQTKKCKQMKCAESIDSLHFDILNGAAIRISYLIALISFIDFKEFSRKFVSTFVAKTESETLESIKKRHCKFVDTAKNLRELVQYFGIHRFDEDGKGPFYISTSNVQYIASFTIRINKPILATKDINVAKQLSKSNGMIMQINNDPYYSSMERFFDCSWIANNHNDKQYVFFGGRCRLKLESVLIIKPQKKYDEIISAFYKFDAALSGVYTNDDITDKEVDIIGSLITYILEYDTESNKMYELDGYTKHCMHWFTKKKTQIVLDLGKLHGIKNKEFINFFMHSIQKQRADKIGNNNINLFKGIIFKLFSNVSEIIIYSSHWDNVYAFNLLSLLSILSACNLSFVPKSYKVLSFGYLKEQEKIYNILIPSSIKQIIKQYHISHNLVSLNRIIIKDIDPDKTGAWLLKSFDHTVVNDYSSKNMNIALKRNQGHYNNQDWMIISV